MSFFIFLVLLIVAVLCIWSYGNDQQQSHNQDVLDVQEEEQSNKVRIKAKIKDVTRINDDTPHVASIVMYNSVTSIGTESPCLVSVGSNKYKITLESIEQSDASDNTLSVPKYLEYIAHENADDISGIFDHLKNGTPCDAILHLVKRADDNMNDNEPQQEHYEVVKLLV